MLPICDVLFKVQYRVTKNSIDWVIVLILHSTELSRCDVQIMNKCVLLTTALFSYNMVDQFFAKLNHYTCTY